MKHHAFTFVLVCFAVIAQAQNFQLHYDFGNPRGTDNQNREYVTTTLEMFRPDSFGSTFWFVDFDYAFPQADAGNSISLAYWEIARNFRIPGLSNIKALSDLELHLEYNDGLISFPAGASYGAASLMPVWLYGLSYPIKLGGVVINTSYLYRDMAGSSHPDFQFTATWFQMFFNGKLTFTGFLDIWSQDKPGGSGKNTVIISEPQLWYSLYSGLSVGTELEISQHFIPGSDQWEFMPTVGLRWDF